MDEYDRKDDQADQDAGRRVFRPPVTVTKVGFFEPLPPHQQSQMA